MGDGVRPLYKPPQEPGADDSYLEALLPPGRSLFFRRLVWRNIIHLRAHEFGRRDRRSSWPSCWRRAPCVEYARRSIVLLHRLSPTQRERPHLAPSFELKVATRHQALRRRHLPRAHPPGSSRVRRKPPRTMKISLLRWVFSLLLRLRRHPDR
jgi:hypothetical protein